jgi:hypothetical protein
MATIKIEAQLAGSSDAQAGVVRRFNVTAALRGAASGSTGGKPKPNPEPAKREG